MVAQALCDVKNSTILVYMILNGKGSNWLWLTWVQSVFPIYFNMSIKYHRLFLKGLMVKVVVVVCCKSAITSFILLHMITNFISKDIAISA